MMVILFFPEIFFFFFFFLPELFESFCYFFSHKKDFDICMKCGAV